MKLAALLIEGESILDMGCGVGHQYPYVKHLKYLGVDNSTPMLEKARQFHPEATFTYGDIYNMNGLPVMDTVLCQSLMIHLPDTDKPIAELWKHTGKALIFSTPIGPKDGVRTVKNIRGKTLLLHIRTWNTIKQALSHLQDTDTVTSHPEPKSLVENTYIKITRKS
jgi:SAM-dependent methyltransferase